MKNLSRIIDKPQVFNYTRTNSSEFEAIFLRRYWFVINLYGVPSELYGYLEPIK